MIPDWHKDTFPQRPLLGYEQYPPLTSAVMAVSTGPKALNDSDGKNVAGFWAVVAEDDVLNVYKLIDGMWGPATEIVVYATSDVVNLALVFDQLGQPMIAIEKPTMVEYYWYDPVSEMYTFTDFGAGTTPIACVDNLENLSSPDTELRCYYVRGNSVLYRRQADRFGEEFELGLEGTNIRLAHCGVTTGFRYQIVLTASEITRRPTDTPSN